MGLPQNILLLAEKNEAFLERINFVPGKDDPRELCTKAAYEQTGLFKDGVVDMIFDQSLVPNEQIPLTTVPQHIGMLLVRPDMMHVSPALEAFVAERFDLLSADDVEVTSDIYWNIYKHDLYRVETMHSRLTRAAMYIGSTCRLIVFSDQTSREYAVADYVHSRLKGSQGVYTPGTIRGDIVFNSALEIGLHELAVPGQDTRLAKAADLFGAYRMLAQEPRGPHHGLLFPLLFYTGVGVHIPDSREICTDLPQFDSTFTT